MNDKDKTLCFILEESGATMMRKTYAAFMRRCLSATVKSYKKVIRPRIRR